LTAAIVASTVADPIRSVAASRTTHFAAPFALVPQSGTFATIYSFHGPPDGGFPQSSLVNVNGTLYGTTAVGGSANEGSVFAVDPATGAERIVYSFAGGNDGAVPAAGLLNVGGTLFGTTKFGGGGTCVYEGSSLGCGTAFALDPATGAETVLYRFQSGKDAEFPTSPLIDVNGTLYGTTPSGGEYCGDGCGAVFALNPATGAETIVHSFKKANANGSEPSGPLLNFNGLLYGTTLAGGLNCVYSKYPCGTVYSVDPATGAERVVYQFKGVPDGDQPIGNLIVVHGLLFGVTQAGGVGGLGGGTIFSLNAKTGAEGVAYSFKGLVPGDTADGYFPQAGLIARNGDLYGTTDFGGDPNTESSGTVFSVNAINGREHVLEHMKVAGGQNPTAALIDLNGTFYGTASLGGAARNRGVGTVFAVKP